MSILSSFKNLFKKNWIEREESEFIEDSEVTPHIMNSTFGSVLESNISEVTNTPEVSVLDMTPKDDWDTKKVRVWKKGDVILGTYKVLDIKVGGMGYVYITEHMSWNIMVAIKCPNEVMLSNSSYFARVLREADAWIGLGLHPHIAYCYYVRQIEEVPNIFIEYVDGGNLRDWIVDKKCWEFDVGLDLAIQFCHGIGFAHGRGMIHRDVKPENILISTEGQLKITDFGIAMFSEDIMEPENTPLPSLNRNSDKDSRLTAVGAVMGSPSYMSPEQWEDSHAVDLRADIYSFGVCMYEMFCARRPYKRSSLDAKDVDETPLDPQEIRPEIPKRLSNLMIKCVDFDPDRRFESFSKLSEELLVVYREMFGKDPEHAKVSDIGLKAGGLNNRAVSYIELGRKDEAIVLWEKALKEDPHHFESIFNYGYLKWQNLELSDEIFLSQIRELESSYSDQPEYWKCLGWIYLETGHLDSVQKIQDSRYRITDRDFQRAVKEYQKPLLKAKKIIKGKNFNIEDFTCLSLYPDGNIAMTGSMDGKVRMWNLQSLNLIRTFTGHDDGVYSIKISPNGRYALSGSGDTTGVIWELAKRKFLKRLKGHNDTVTCAEFFPDGNLVVTGSSDSSIIIWDIVNGKPLRHLKGHDDAVFSLALSYDGKYLISGSKDNSLILWDIYNSKPVKRFLGHNDAVYGSCISHDLKHLLSCSGDHSVKLWNLDGSKAELREYIIHNSPISCVEFSPNGKFAVTGGWDKVLRMWRVNSGHGSWHHGHNGRITSASFTPSGNNIVSSGLDGNIIIWDVNYPPEIGEHVHPHPLICRVRSVAKLDSEGKKVKSIISMAKEHIKQGNYQKAYRLIKQGQSIPGYERDKEFMDILTLCVSWGGAKRKSLKNAWQIRKFQGHTDWITSLSFSPNMKYILTCAWDKTVRLWDILTGKQVKLYDNSLWFGNESVNVASLQFSSDNRYAVLGSWDKKIRICDVKTGQAVKIFEGHSGYVNSVRYSNNNKYVLSGGADKTVRLWQVATGKEVRRFTGHRGVIHSVDYSPDNRFAISASEDNSVKLWDIVDNDLIKSFEGHYNSVFSCAFSHDGKHILSGSEDGTIRIWEISSGREVQKFDGHTSVVSSVCFSPDSRFVLSGGKDNTMRLWQVSSGREVRKFEGHTGWITRVLFSPDGRYALSGGWDNNVLLWEFDWEWEM